MTSNKIRIYSIITILLFAVIFLSVICQAKSSFLQIKIIFDNVIYSPKFKSAWGFSCIIEGMEKVILFDTGFDSSILLANMEKMGVSPNKIDAVFLSHIHGDHIGGLQGFLQQNPKVTVYLPASFPASFQDSITARRSTVRAIDKPEKLFDKVYTSGEMGAGIKEQSLVMDTPKGLVIITGCAHPGVIQIVARIKNWFKKEVYLLLGGFHWEGKSLAELQPLAAELKKLGVKKVAPSHCTGETARKLLREHWGPNFIESGAGAVIELRF